MKNRENEKGFVALISAILIAVALLTLVTAAGFSGFFVRFSILGSEVKERSIFLAESCVSIATIELFQDPGYLAGFEKTDFPGGGECRIVSITAVGPDRVIEAQGVFQNTYTNLRVEVDTGDPSTIPVEAWEEVPNF